MESYCGGCHWRIRGCLFGLYRLLCSARALRGKPRVQGKQHLHSRGHLSLVPSTSCSESDTLKHTQRSHRAHSSAAGSARISDAVCARADRHDSGSTARCGSGPCGPDPGHLAGMQRDQSRARSAAARRAGRTSGPARHAVWWGRWRCGPGRLRQRGFAAQPHGRGLGPDAGHAFGASSRIGPAGCP
jgi:hypothetical protein